MRKGRNIRERMGALLLAILVSLTSVLPGTGLTAKAADPTEHTINFYVYEEYMDAQNQLQKLPVSGANVTLTVSNKSYEGTTDKEGKVSIKAVYDADTVTTGTYTVNKAGYEAGQPTNIQLADYADGIKEAESKLTLSNIQVSASNIILEKGSNQTVTINNKVDNAAEGEPGYTWASENESIATVSNGTITAVAKGSTNVTVSRFGKKAEIPVTVNEKLSNMQLVVSPNTGKDQTEVTFTLTGMPSDANQTVALYMNNSSIGTISSNNGQWTTTVSNLILKGDIIFKAVYPNDSTKYYLETAVSTETLNYKQTADLELTEPGKTVTYGDNGNQGQITVKDGSDKGRTLTYTSSDPDAVEVDQTGVYKIYKAGTVTITVTAAASTEYAESIAEFVLTVEEKAITVEKEDIEWQPASKIYDGSRAITLTGKVKADGTNGVVGTDELVIKAEVEVAGTDVTETPFTEATIKKVYAAGADEEDEVAVNGNYTITIADDLKEGENLTGLAITITHRPVYIEIKEPDSSSSVSYGQSNTEIFNAIKDQYEIVLSGQNGTNGDTGSSETEGLVGDDTLNLTDYTSISLVDNTYYVQDDPYENVLKLTIKDDIDAGNYQIFVADGKEYGGQLTITPQEVTLDDILNNITIINDQDKGVYLPDDTDKTNIWLRATHGELSFKLTDTTYYDQLVVSVEGIDYSFDENGGTPIIFSEEGEKSLSLQLKNTKDPNGKTVTTGDHEITVNVDKTNPTVEFSGLGCSGIFADNMNTPNFNKLANDENGYNITIRANDDNNGEPGSGLASLQTKVVSVATDETMLDEIKAAALDDKDWSNQNLSDSEVGISTNGNYIVLAKVRDNVGNEVVYTSNGLVYETNEPVITITRDEIPEGGLAGNGDLGFSVKINDLEGSQITSGIASVDIRVTDGETEVVGSAEKDTEGKIVCVQDSYSLSSEEINELCGITTADKEGSLSYIVKKSCLNIAGNLNVEKYHTGNVKIIVTVTDGAGNTMTASSESFNLDTKKPEVTVTLDPEGEKSGDYFYGAARTMTMVITERNFDERGVSFDVVVDGKPQTDSEGQEKRLTVAELDELDNVTIAREDPQEGNDPDTWKDDRKITYKITFEGDGAYRIQPYVTDTTGNASDSITGKSFYIDTTAPTISVDYNDKDLSLNNGKYFNSSRVMNITYTERNFSEDLLTFDVTIDGTPYENITLEKLREYGNQADITVGELKDDQSEVGDAGEYTNERKNTLEITFGADGKDHDYKITPKIKDLAGNQNIGITDGDGTKVSTGEDFTVDQVIPTVSVDYYLVDEEQGGDDLDEKIDISSEEAINKATRLYKNKTIRAEVKITERNFGSDQEIFSTSQIDPNFTWIQNDGTDGDVTGFTEAARKVSEWTTDPDNSDVRVQTFDFILEGDYIFGMQYTDLAGNEAVDANNTSSIGYSEHYFTVDKTAPKINVVYKVNGQKIEPGTGEGERLFETDTITAEVTIDERNFFREDEQTQFEQGQMDLIYTAKNFDGNNVTVDDYRGKANTRAGWEKVDDGSSPYVRRQIFTFSEDANYTLKLDYTDLAGNKAVDSSDESIGHAMRYFTVDREAPTGDIIIDGTIFSDFCNMITFGFFTNEQEVVTFTQKDETSGVATAQYYKYIPDVDSKGKFNGLTLEELKAIEEWEDAVPLVLNTEQQAVIYQKIVDRAGHVTYISANEGIIVDKKKPEPHIDITTAEPEHGIYNGNVDFQISVTDSVSGGTYAGLREVYYEVRKDGQVTQQGNYNSEFEDWTQRQQSLIKNETVNANLNNSNNVEIWVKAVDWAGNEQEVTKELAIDITKPTIEVTYDLNSPLNERYYNNTRTATVVVTERNFDPSAVQFDITNTDGTRPSISGWTNSAANGVSDNTTHTCYITYQADGDYTFTMNVTDLANNRTEYGKVDEFTIDQTDPTIQVSYDNNNDETEGYFNENRTATITVTEHNFNAAEVNAMITASLQGSGVSAPGVGGWSTRGDVHTASVTFSQDADYTFDIEYTDLAGNAAADYTEDRFTVDKTAPEIEFFDIEDKSANKGVVAPGVRYSDVNYTEAGVNITIEGAKDEHSVTALSGDRSSIPNGESIKMADFAHTEENDDVYTMKAVIRDKAGNETEETVLFSVNRFGSTYEFAPETKEFLDKFYTNDPQDIIVTERNVDTLVFNGISYGRDGRQTELKEGEDYTVKASGSEVSWKQYIYNISKDNFQEEGRYNVTIDSQDRAENIMNNKVKGLDIEFVVDKTAPTVVVTGIEAGAYREDSRDMSINVADNTAVEKVEVLINGTRAEEYSQKEIEQMDGELTYTISDDNDPQDILVVATDLAGNEGSSDEQSVLVTANLFIQFINNTPLLIGTIVAIIAIAGGLSWFFLVYKKRKEEEQSA